MTPPRRAFRRRLRQGTSRAVLAGMPPPADRTHSYHTWLNWSDGRGALAARGRPLLPVAVPREFGGPGDEWSPEELLVGATEACMMATFTALAKRRGLLLAGCHSSATGTLGRSPAGFAFTGVSIALRIAVRSEGDRAVAAAVAEQAHSACFIGSTLRCPVALDYTIEVAEAVGDAGFPAPASGRAS